MKLHIFRLALMSVIMLVSASCSHESVLIDIPNDNVKLTLGLSVPTDGSGYREGTANENFIDITGGNYRIYFFDSSKKLIARFQPSDFSESDGGGYKTYKISGKAPMALASYSQFKIVVLANWERYNDELKPGSTTIDDLCNDVTNATYKCLTNFQLSPTEHRLIPFYGVHDYTGVTFEADRVTYLTEPVTLLRAMAKVEVVPNTTIALSDVKIVGYNQKGFCAPSGIYSQTDYGQGNDWTNDYLPNLHLINGKNDEKATTYNLTLQKETASDGTEKWYAYLPEYDNINAADKYAYLELKLKGQDNPYQIYFAQYDKKGKTDNTKRLNLERNNIYRFDVTASPLLLLVSVEKWVFGGKVHIDLTEN